VGVLSCFNGFSYGYWVILRLSPRLRRGFGAFFYGFAVLALLSAVILFFVGPVGGFWAVFPGKF
jgi:hypothetical protein